MSDHPFWRDLPAVHQIGQQTLQRCHLCFGKRLVTRISQFDPDGARVHVRHHAPGPCPGVPGAHVQRHELDDLATAVDQQVRRDPQPGQVGDAFAQGQGPVDPRARERLVRMYRIAKALDGAVYPFE
mgnify:CR=1 FL=1